MFNAMYFTYDGVYSGTYGLTIADFNDDAITETQVFSPTLNTIKPPQLNRFLHNGVFYNQVPQFQFSVISEREIPDFVRREILSWLVGRKEFKPLQIHQADLEDYFYNCVFTNTEIIYVNGRCHGFKLTANFDSHYAYGKNVVEKLSSGKMIIHNRSDIYGEYTYPTIEFTVGTTPLTSNKDAIKWASEQPSLKNADGTSSCNSYDVCITNLTDDTQRHFVLAGLRAGEKITVNNEIKHISSSIAGEKLSHFNRNWLRLRPGKNELKVEINDTGDGEIRCPTYIMIGF